MLTIPLKEKYIPNRTVWSLLVLAEHEQGLNLCSPS